ASSCTRCSISSGCNRSEKRNSANPEGLSMSTDLEANLADVGYAKVIVALSADAQPNSVGAAATPLEQHFVRPDEVQAPRLAFVAARAASTHPRGARTIPKVHVFPQLALALGYVDRQGMDSLSGDSRVRSVVPAPEISLVRPVSIKASASPSTSPTWGI